MFHVVTLKHRGKLIMCTPACAKCSLYTERKSPVSCPVQHLNYRVHLTLYNLRIEDNATYPRIQFIFVINLMLACLQNSPRVWHSRSIISIKSKHTSWSDYLIQNSEVTLHEKKYTQFLQGFWLLYHKKMYAFNSCRFGWAFPKCGRNLAEDWMNKSYISTSLVLLYCACKHYILS